MAQCIGLDVAPGILCSVRCRQNKVRQRGGDPCVNRDGYVSSDLKDRKESDSESERGRQVAL